MQEVLEAHLCSLRRITSSVEEAYKGFCSAICDIDSDIHGSVRGALWDTEGAYSLRGTAGVVMTADGKEFSGRRG